MAGAHVALDHVLFVLIVLVWPVAEWLFYYPRSVRAIKSGVARARGRLYRNILLPEWGFTACVIALWAAQGRSWSALRLGAGTPLRLGIGFAIAGLFLGLVWAQRRALLARPEGLELVRRKIEHADALMPHTVGERRTFAAVAITAGICEECLFRGFVMRYFASWFAEGWVGVVLAVVITSVLFGFAHIYLGAQDVLTTGIGGAVLCARRTRIGIAVAGDDHPCCGGFEFGRSRVPRGKRGAHGGFSELAALGFFAVQHQASGRGFGDEPTFLVGDLALGVADHFAAAHDFPFRAQLCLPHRPEEITSSARP